MNAINTENGDGLLTEANKRPTVFKATLDYKTGKFIKTPMVADELNTNAINREQFIHERNAAFTPEKVEKGILTNRCKHLPVRLQFLAGIIKDETKSVLINKIPRFINDNPIENAFHRRCLDKHITPNPVKSYYTMFSPKSVVVEQFNCYLPWYRVVYNKLFLGKTYVRVR